MPLTLQYSNGLTSSSGRHLNRADPKRACGIASEQACGEAGVYTDKLAHKLYI